ncbi:MAG: YwaF family protein [Bacilli bacterium]|nr:YwaF family protein [Bacilli bacterium]
MKEFFGFGGYNRIPEGYMSWQHLTFVTILMVIMVTLAIYLGMKNRYKLASDKNKVLIWAAILIDGFELFKIILCCFRGNDPFGWLYNLPLFLCSIQLITIPLAAFSKGRVKESALDFVFIFGILGAVLGTYAAGQNYAAYPVLSFDNVVSGITHSISGFSSLYIAISGMASMKRKNLPITFSILFGFAIAAYIANITLDYNYMFLMAGDGTPYDIIYNLVNGNKVIYPLSVILLFVVYIFVFHTIYSVCTSRSTLTTKETETSQKRV